MTTHLSARLAWHDRGWDGRVCDAPHLNAHCIVHQHIRDSRDDEKERRFAGTALSELDGWLPPCSRDPAAYAERGFVIVHRDPLEFRRLPSVSEDLPPYSSCPAPYRWMREEFFQEVCEAEDLTIRGPDEARSNGWVFEPDRQRALLKRFWGKLEHHNSLKRCALGLDLYLWLVYRTFALRTPQPLTWRQLYHQFDAAPAKLPDKFTVRNFRSKCLRELRKIKLAWPGLNYATAKGVLILLPSTPAIAPLNQGQLTS